MEWEYGKLQQSTGNLAMGHCHSIFFLMLPIKKEGLVILMHGYECKSVRIELMRGQYARVSLTVAITPPFCYVQH